MTRPAVQGKADRGTAAGNRQETNNKGSFVPVNGGRFRGIHVIMGAMKEGEATDQTAAGTPLGDALSILRALRENDSKFNPESSDCKIEIRNQGNSNPELYISGTIGYRTDTERVSDFVKEQNGDFTVGINSGGGGAWEGIAINSIFRNYDRGEITTRIDGRAASAAGVIFLAGDKRQIMDTARLMLHEASIMGFIEGTKDRVKQQLENILEAMDQVNASIVESVVQATGLDKAKAAGISNFCRSIF